MAKTKIIDFFHWANFSDTFNLNRRKNGQTILEKKLPGRPIIMDIFYEGRVEKTGKQPKRSESTNENLAPNSKQASRVANGQSLIHIVFRQFVTQSYGPLPMLLIDLKLCKTKKSNRIARILVDSFA